VDRSLRRNITAQFRAKFPDSRPVCCVVAPGRINLIGEHTDYNGFAVLPIAIDRAIYAVVAPLHEPVVELHSAEPECFGPRRFAVQADVEPYEPGDWGNYVKAAVQSLVRRRLQEGRDLQGLCGMRCLIAGTIPRSSGVASSSALVIASALAFMAVNAPAGGLELSEEVRRSLAEQMAQAEHYVGTQGGGMDQAACLTARSGCAVRIDFFPLKARTVAFPGDHVVLAADSTVRAGKALDKRLAYNRRVVECRIGTELLARRLGARSAERLADLCAPRGRHSGAELMALLQEITGGRASLSPGQAAALLDMSGQEFTERMMRMKNGSLLPAPDDGLKVLPRCRHVFAEAWRVEEAVCRLEDRRMAELGRLMDASHRSCALDYEVSVPELDRLTELMRSGGALGARLTGAGFGGFAVALIRSDQAPALRERLSREFYEPRGASADDNVHAFAPCGGAAVLPPA